MKERGVKQRKKVKKEKEKKREIKKRENEKEREIKRGEEQTNKQNYQRSHPARRTGHKPLRGEPLIKSLNQVKVKMKYQFLRD